MEIQINKFGAVAADACLITGQVGIVLAIVAPIVALAAQIFQNTSLAQPLLLASPISLAVGIPSLFIGICLAFVFKSTPPIYPGC